jgi:glycerol-3-phosphate acyltransferase PlsY
MITLAVVVIASYLVGAVPWSLLIVRWVKGIDLRTVGSGNLGATNTFRALGARGGLVVLALDIGKGFVAPGVIAHLRIDPPPIPGDGLALAAGLAAILGHMFPVYTRFRGGKGIATTAGVFLGLEPRACLVAIAAFALGFGASRGIVSVGSLAASLVLPFAVYALGPHGGATAAVHVAVASALAVLIWAKHSSNLARLVHGRETSILRPVRRTGP